MKGLTLIETLLTITLVTMAAAVGVGVIGGASEASAASRALSAASDLDHLARRTSIRSGPVEFIAFPTHAVVMHQDEVVAQRPVVIQLATSDGLAVEAVRFGRDGRTDDYQIIVADRIVHVAGATGYMREKAP